MQVRLQKILSTAGISSRRASEAIITGGRVTVNGTTVTELGSKADPDTDDIRVDGRRVKTARARRYILMYKPRGYITTRSDPEQRPTVVDLLTKGGVRDYVYPVGRLDYESEGLLILTSDGDLADQLMHPSHGVAREYHARVRGVPGHEALERLARGVVLDGRRTAPADVTIEKLVEGTTGNDAIVSFVIHEGRNRQVRRMCDAVGFPVLRLKRVRIGPIRDEHIRPGEFRDLSPQEIAALKREAAKRPSRGAESTSNAGRSTSNAARSTSNVGRSTSPVARSTSNVGRSTSPVARSTSHVARSTSHVARRTSHVGPRTSNVSTPPPTPRPKTERAPTPRPRRPNDRPRRG